MLKISSLLRCPACPVALAYGVKSALPYGSEAIQWGNYFTGVQT